MNIKLLIYFAGICHFGILIASALAPIALDWKESLKTLPEILRRMFWVYGGFIVMMIIGFGVLTLVFADELLCGTPLANGVCALISIFWGVRLAVQFFVFDAKPYLTRTLYRIGYHALTLVFIFLTIFYGWLALR